MYKFLLLFVAVLRCILIAECYVEPILPNGRLPHGGLPNGRFPYRELPGTGGRMNGNCQSFNQRQEQYVRCFEQQPLNVQEIMRSRAGASSVEAVRKWVCLDTGDINQMISEMRRQNIDFTEHDRRLFECVYPGSGRRLLPGLGSRLEPGLGSRLGPGLGSRLEPGLGSRLEPGLAFQDKKQDKAQD